MSKAGVQTAVVTAKDKLLKVLAYEMEGIAFSSEHPNTADLTALGFKNGEEMVGRGKPDQYSADLSLFALDAGLKLLETARPGLMYLSTSDYVQHKYEPGDDESNVFHSEVDRRIARMPFLLSRPPSREYRERAERGVLRNYDIFDFALNGVE
jgi:phosphonoacetate hydrolase